MSVRFFDLDSSTSFNKKLHQKYREVKGVPAAEGLNFSMTRKKFAKVRASASLGKCQLGEVLVWGSVSLEKCQLSELPIEVQTRKI